jgi:hypothetical protein
MNKRAATVLVLFAGMATCTSATAQEAGARAGSGSYSPPKLADGTPDFRGIWRARTTAYLNIEGHPAEAGRPAAKSILIDPPDGKIPYLPGALSQRERNYAHRAVADPANNCFQAGVPRASFLPTPLQIFESVGHFAIVYTDNHSYRIVLPSSIPHDDGIDFFMGDSRAHWEGNTLVVDVADLGEQTWLDAAGNYHSDQLRVLERYTLLGPDTMRYQATMVDPIVYARPWTVRVFLDRVKGRNARIIEDECIDGPDGIWHHISPLDPRALLRHDYQAELEAEKKRQPGTAGWK